MEAADKLLIKSGRARLRELYPAPYYTAWRVDRHAGSRARGWMAQVIPAGASSWAYVLETMPLGDLVGTLAAMRVPQAEAVTSVGKKDEMARFGAMIMDILPVLSRQETEELQPTAIICNAFISVWEQMRDKNAMLTAELARLRAEKSPEQPEVVNTLNWPDCPGNWWNDKLPYQQRVVRFVRNGVEHFCIYGQQASTDREEWERDYGPTLWAQGKTDPFINRRTPSS